MNHLSSSPSSRYNDPPPHYLNRTDPERRPGPADPSDSPGYPIRPPYPKRPIVEDGIGDLASFIGFQPSAPVYVSARARKRVGRLQIISVFGVVVLLGLWFYSRYRTMVFQADTPAYPGDIPQEFRPNPTRYVQQRHTTTLRSDLPYYSFTSLSGWANGTFEILAAEKGEDMIKFDVLVESPTIKISDLFVYDDSKAQDKGAIVMKLSDRVSPPRMSKWIKLHARLILPTHRTYPTLKVQLFPELPYWYKINMDAIDVTSGIIFKTLDLTTRHGDIEVKSLSASKLIMETSRGDIRHGRLNVSPENLLISTGKGSVTPI